MYEIKAHKVAKLVRHTIEQSANHLVCYIRQHENVQQVCKKAKKGKKNVEINFPYSLIILIILFCNIVGRSEDYSSTILIMVHQWNDVEYSLDCSLNGDEDTCLFDKLF